MAAPATTRYHLCASRTSHDYVSAAVPKLIDGHRPVLLPRTVRQARPPIPRQAHRTAGGDDDVGLRTGSPIDRPRCVLRRPLQKNPTATKDAFGFSAETGHATTLRRRTETQPNAPVPNYIRVKRSARLCRRTQPQLDRPVRKQGSNHTARASLRVPGGELRTQI
jgi:hypothetical protein